MRLLQNLRPDHYYASVTDMPAQELYERASKVSIYVIKSTIYKPGQVPFREAER